MSEPWPVGLLFLYFKTRDISELTNALFCFTGKPTVVLTKDGDPAEGESVTLTCSAISTTDPVVSMLAFTYSWTYDSARDPADARYTYSANTFTIRSVTQADSGKVVTCTATEDVAGGLTSAPSNGVNFTVSGKYLCSSLYLVFCLEKGKGLPHLSSTYLS